MLDWFSQSMADILQSSCNTWSKGHRYILVHGAGSFGHFTAKEYGLRSASSDAIIDETQQAFIAQGVAETRLSVQTLNQKVIASLTSKQVPAVGLSPMGLGLPCPTTPESKELFQSTLRNLISTTLDAGFIPVLHGDACLYGMYGAGIVGGDMLLELLGPVATKAVFVTDVAGIFTSNPHEDPTATLVPLIEVHGTTGEVSTPGVVASGSSHEHDVTGGLAAKLGAAAAIASTNLPVAIVQCGTRSAQEALKGNKFETGTRVVRKPTEELV